MRRRADLPWLRSTLKTSLPDSAVVHRLTPTSDGAGGSTTVTAAVAQPAAARRADGSLPALLEPTDAAAVEQELAERLGTRRLYDLTLPFGADVQAADRVVMLGRTFEVIVAPKRGSLDTSVDLIVVDQEP